MSYLEFIYPSKNDCQRTSLTKIVVGNIIFTIIIIQIIVLPIIHTNELIFGSISGKTAFFTISMLFVLFFGIINIICSKSVILNFCKIDFILLLISCYILLNLIIKGNPITNTTIEFFGLCFMYFSFRFIKHKYGIFILMAIMLSNIIQCLYGYLQIWGVLDSLHQQFSLTGGFFNPGPYAGYLASSFPIIAGVCFLRVKGSKNEFSSNSITLLKYISVCALILSLIILPATGSRAAWISVFFSSLFIVFYRFSLIKRIKRFARWKISVLITITSVLIFLSIAALYIYKVNSANGRILIWKTSLNIIKKEPLTGVGFDGFKSYYMNEQAEYFQKNPNSEFVSVAGDVEYCFNDILQFVVENGIVGLILLSLLFFYLIKHPADSSERYKIFILKTCLLGILIFGLFSYPSQILPIKVNAICYLALLAIFDSTTYRIELKLDKIKKIFTAIFSIFVLFCGIAYIYCYIIAWANWNKAFQFYSQKAYGQSSEYYSKAYSFLSKNGDFLTNYGKMLATTKQYDKAITILNTADQQNPNIVALAALGDCHKATGEFKLAEQFYLRACYMNPSRLYTRYLLAKLYDETDQDEKAIVIATELLSEKVKVESTAVNEIRMEMRDILNRKLKKMRKCLPG